MRTPRWQKLFDEIEMPLVPVLSRIERNGVLVDVASCWRSRAANWASACSSWSGEAYELAGQPFNLGSPKQIGEILFDKLQAAGAARRRPPAQPSTAEEVLQELALDYPLPRLHPGAIAAWPSSSPPTPTSCRR